MSPYELTAKCNSQNQHDQPVRERSLYLNCCLFEVLRYSTKNGIFCWWIEAEKIIIKSKRFRFYQTVRLGKNYGSSTNKPWDGKTGWWLRQGWEKEQTNERKKTIEQQQQLDEYEKMAFSKSVIKHLRAAIKDFGSPSGFRSD